MFEQAKFTASEAGIKYADAIIVIINNETKRHRIMLWRCEADAANPAHRLNCHESERTYRDSHRCFADCCREAKLPTRGEDYR